MTQLQKLISQELANGRDFDSIMEDLRKEADGAKTIYEEKLKEKEAEAKKAQHVSFQRTKLLEALEEYLIALDLVEKKDITKEKRAKLENILKDIEKTDMNEGFHLGWNWTDRSLFKLFNDLIRV